MNKQDYFPPLLAGGQFHCPHCHVYAKQRWSHLRSQDNGTYTKYNPHNHMVQYEAPIANMTYIGDVVLPEIWSLSQCEHCNEFTIWKTDLMIYPKTIVVPPPNNDLEEDIKSDYMEAANILNESPRSAAALLRLCLQKLCKQLGEKGKNINDDIAELVKKGLNPIIQKSLDALRINGNNAVHPGEIDLSEDTARVIKLFGLINFIAEKMISEPKEIESFYDSLPEKAKNAVEERDKQN
jgi:hypothetical protein